MTGKELITHVEVAAARLGYRPTKGFKLAGMPWGFIRAAGIVYPLWRELARMSYLWRKPHQLDSSALRTEVGPLPDTEPSVAVYEALQALGFGARPKVP